MLQNELQNLYTFHSLENTLEEEIPAQVKEILAAANNPNTIQQITDLVLKYVDKQSLFEKYDAIHASLKEFAMLSLQDTNSNPNQKLAKELRAIISNLNALLARWWYTFRYVILFDC